MTITRPHPSHFGKSGKPKPGEFKATCRLTGHAAKFETDDAELFEAHMLEAHGAKPGMCAKRRVRKVNGQEIWGPIEGFIHRGDRKQIRFGQGLWRAPRLTEAGKPFEPKDLEPGATVTWRELIGTGEFFESGYSGRTERREWVERSGQVWCAGWRPNSAWVIPFEKLEGEQAVMVEQRSNGELEHYSTQQSRRAA